MMRPEDAVWYDEHYRKEQTQFAPWYRWLIPDLRNRVTAHTKLIELGCGQGQLLRHLARESIIPPRHLYGLEQSKTAVEFVNKWLPDANVQLGDIYTLEYSDAQFDICCLMETIEHLEDPAKALAEIRRILKAGGILYISFPNFLHLPWLAVRLLSDLLNKPNWIVRQPIDIIYFVPQVIRLVKASGFRFLGGIGANYGPPILYPLEKPWVTKFLNSIGIWWLSFHPILVFQKP